MCVKRVFHVHVFGICVFGAFTYVHTNKWDTWRINISQLLLVVLEPSV